MRRKKNSDVHRKVGAALHETCRRAEENLEWLRGSLHPYFFITMQEETDALVSLASGMHGLSPGRRLVLADEEMQLIVAGLNEPGSFYDSLRTLDGRGVSYAELTHSFHPLPGRKHKLEIQRYEFERRISLREGSEPEIPGEERLRQIERAVRRQHRRYDFQGLQEALFLLARNNPRYLRVSPPERIARLLWLYDQGARRDGLYLDAEKAGDDGHDRETRLLFSVGNPPEKDFLSQVMEVFARLGVGVQRAYCLQIRTEESPWFLGTFYVSKDGGSVLEKDSALYETLRAELYNTQILSTTSRPYGDFVIDGFMTGEDASLTNAFIAFCHTSLAHNQPDRFHLTEVVAAFISNRDVTTKLCQLFRARFDPDGADREKEYSALRRRTEGSINSYNTGHRHLDELRRSIYRTALLFVGHTLKTNFFVPEKNALAFRLDPAYLQELGPDVTDDLPKGNPFRITFFSGRHGVGYHVGFADIARGGWRTIVSSDEDDYNENAEALFREVYVLAHTQHLKNKDIYEGGSKMVVVLDTSDVDDERLRTQRLYKIQSGFINAFFDLFARQGGGACHSRVVDYYGDEEVIELGPDENMHDFMIEKIARQAVQRKYLLGAGVISSKKAGINHREYGVTALGVVTFAETVMKELGVDIRKDSFSVKVTGGPGGDVAGNTLRLLLERCPRVAVKLVIDGSGVLFDPRGMNRRELKRLLLTGDIDSFSPENIHPGGFLLSRRSRRKDGMRVLHCRFTRTTRGVSEEWITADELNSAYENLLFDVPADLFIPAGGRPETVHTGNSERFFDNDDRPTCRAIVEGANSFLTPPAREALQRRGIVVIRDASANKCGVISSSYEIIANLLLKEEEFLAHKERYVGDVLKILEKRAGDEARLIFRRRSESSPPALWTEISDNLSFEINEWYSRLFDYFQSRPEILAGPPYRRVLMAHLPELIGRDPRFRRRTARLPVKYRCAMVASEIASRIVYEGGWETDFESSLTGYVKKAFRSRE